MSEDKKSRTVIQAHITTDWADQAERRGIEDFRKIWVVNKKAGMERIKRIPLPHFKFLDDIPYSEFIKGSDRIDEFLGRHEQFFLRIRPKKKHPELPKKPLIGTRDYKEMKEFAEKVARGNEDRYLVDLMEHSEIDRAGLIVSNRARVSVEMLNGGLDALCYWATPHASMTLDLTGYGPIEKRMDWKIKGAKEDRKFIRDCLTAIEHGNCGANPRLFKGYFEILGKKGLKGRESLAFFDWITESIYFLESPAESEAYNQREHV